MEKLEIIKWLYNGLDFEFNVGFAIMEEQNIE